MSTASDDWSYIESNSRVESVQSVSSDVQEPEDRVDNSSVTSTDSRDGFSWIPSPNLNFADEDFPTTSSPPSLRNKTKSVPKFVRRKGRTRREQLRRRRRLSQLATITESKQMNDVRLLHIRQGEVQTMNDVDECLRGLVDKERTKVDDVLDLCNHMAETGTVRTLDGIEIDLRQSTFVSERLRHFCFMRLFVDAFTEWNTRMNWIGLKRSARMMMIPMASIEQFRQMFVVHETVPMSALVRVTDMTGFNILSRDEWIRVATFRTYCDEVAKSKSRDAGMLSNIVKQSMFVNVPFPSMESIRKMACRLELAVTEEDIESTFSSSVFFSEA